MRHPETSRLLFLGNRIARSVAPPYTPTHSAVLPIVLHARDPGFDVAPHGREQPIPHRLLDHEVGQLRSLDAIHLATAQVLTNESGTALTAFVTYDRRLLECAKAAGYRWQAVARTDRRLSDTSSLQPPCRISDFPAHPPE